LFDALSGDAVASQDLYLRPNIMVEPLVDGWYAWPHLIPPATASRNISERHLRIMESYINAPDSHAAAVKNPKLLGGPFMDFQGNKVPEVKELRDRTIQQRSHLLELSRDIVKLDDLLRTKATGYSLESLYAEVPESLRGYVELVYDLNNHPSFRLLEPLLYRSKYYDRSMQSLRLSVIGGDDRPFVLSTPRLENDDDLEVRLPFESEQIDGLFQLKTRPACFPCIQTLLGCPDAKQELVRSFLTEQKPPPYEKYDGGGARWRYFGHACVLLETKDVSILLDPVLSYTYESGLSRYTYQDLPEVIDFVLITHNHQDHLLFETLLQLRHRIRTVIVPRNAGGSLQDPSLRLILNNCGFRDVREVSDMDELCFDSGSITAIPFLGEHADLNITSKAAYLVRVGGHSLLFAADSCNINPPMYEHVHRWIGDVEVLFIGMECDGAPLSWIYGPLLTQKLERNMDHSRRLAGSNYERAIGMVDQFRCKEIYVYAMGQEPWLNYVMSLKYTEQSNPIIQSNRLIATCLDRGLVAERLFGEKELFLS
jgi:L-ascorbate metabolism protein UlaG (beta-lactamase superfamily)